MHPFDFAIIAAYLAAIVFMGFRLSQRVHDARDYFLAGRSLTWIIIGLSIIGTNVSAEGYVGASGGAYNSGIAQANFEWIGAIPAMILASLVFIPLYWRSGVYSIPEYLGRRYNQPVRVLAALIASIFAIFAIGVSLWAIALTLQSYLDWPIWVGIVVMGTVVGLYSISGGLAAVAFTDALQVVIMFLGGVAIVALGISDAGGATGVWTKPSMLGKPDPPAGVPAGGRSGVSPGQGVILGSRHRALARLLVRRPGDPAAHPRRPQPMGCQRLDDVRRVSPRRWSRCSSSSPGCWPWSCMPTSSTRTWHCPGSSRTCCRRGFPGSCSSRSLPPFSPPSTRRSTPPR